MLKQRQFYDLPLDTSRFMAHVLLVETGCWEWRGAKKNGYGVYSIKGFPHAAYICSYVYVHGPVPPDRVVDHLCENKRCVNPDHLEAVTQGNNVRRSFFHRRGVPRGLGDLPV